MKDITINEIARVIEPEAWKESDKCESQGMTPEFEVNLKCVQSLTAAKRVTDYLYNVVFKS